MRLSAYFVSFCFCCFMLQAFKNVLDKFMGVNLDGQKPKAGTK
jgi:hypothetical protein